MSNRLELRAMKFEETANGCVGYGYILVDDYEKHCEDGWEASYEDDVELLRAVYLSAPAEVMDTICAHVYPPIEKGMYINDTWYTAKQVEDFIDQFDEPQEKANEQ